MIIDVSKHSSSNVYRLLSSSIVPRPIAWVSTVSPEGRVNLAPFSYFNAVTSRPPLVSISVGRRRGKRKDTAQNASLTGELVINMVPIELREKMVATSAEVGPEISEVELADVQTLPSERVTPPRIAGCPISFECRTHQIIELSPGIVDLVIAEVLVAHVADDVAVSDDLSFSSRGLALTSRLGVHEYGTIGEVTELKRPT